MVLNAKNQLWKRHANHITFQKQSDNRVESTSNKNNSNGDESLLVTLNKKCKQNPKATNFDVGVSAQMNSRGNLQNNANESINPEAVPISSSSSRSECITSAGCTDRPKRLVRKPNKVNL